VDVVPGGDGRRPRGDEVVLLAALRHGQSWCMARLAGGGALAGVAVARELPWGREAPVRPPASAPLARALALVPLAPLRVGAKDRRTRRRVAAAQSRGTAVGASTGRHRVAAGYGSMAGASWIARRSWRVAVVKEEERRRGVGFANRTSLREPF
jgi:hypothetical protein